MALAESSAAFVDSAVGFEPGSCVVQAIEGRGNLDAGSAILEDQAPRWGGADPEDEVRFVVVDAPTVNGGILFGWWRYILVASNVPETGRSIRPE